MIVNRRMHCTVDREPNSYHRQTTPGTSVHAVNLGFECVSDLADDDPHLADDESSGKADFAQFLAAIASLDFHLYAIQPDNTATRVIQATAWAQPFSGKPADIMAWLDDQPRGRRFWTEAVQGADVAIEIAHNQAGATHLLRGAQAWSAPVAHHFGLTRLIGVEQDLTMPHIVLPAMAGTTPADSIAVTLLTVPGESAPLWEAEMGHGLVCRASQLQASLAPSALLDADGYLPVHADAEQTRRVLDGFERRWAGLMFALPSLLAPGAAGKAADNEALGDLFAPLWVYQPASSTQTTPESWRLHAPEAAWRIATGLVAALDPIIVALLRPAGSTAKGSGAEGDILAALISHLMDECESQPSVPAPSAAQWRDLLRAMLRQSPLLGGVGAAVDHLVRVHGLAPLTATSPASVHLLNLLLRIAGGDAVVLERAQIEAVAATITGTDAEGFRPDAYAEVTAAACRLQEEGGCETAIIALFAGAAAEWSNVPTAIHHQLCAAAGKPDDDPDLLVLRDAISRAWQGFVDQLNGPFNGLDAVRRSATADCLEALLAQYQAQDDGSAASAQLAALLAESDYFAGRLRLVPAAPPSPGCFAVVTDALVAVPFETSKRVGAQSADAFLQGWLAREFHDAATPSGPLQQDVSRFVADLVAHPLPLQIATDFGAAALDDFAKTYNGIAFALRRRDDPAGTSDRWSHASLADFHWPNLHQPRAAGASNATGLQHWLPVAQDGRGPMFRDYEGFPFASKAIAKGQADNGPTLERRRLPFFDADVASYAGSGFAGVPMLAYGRTFETFSFATTNAGSLPLALQTADQPWLPKPQFEGPTTVYSAPYHRRTAVGAVTLHSQDGTPWPGAITDVQPLSADYPRHALCATPQAPGVIELMRDADGDGMLAFPLPDLEQGIAARRVDLVDLAWSGGRGDLRIELFRAAAEAGAASSFQFNFVGIDATSLTEPRISIWLETVLVDPLGPDDLSAQRRLRAQLGAGAVQTLDPITPLDGWWMRLTLTSSAGPVALSFADDSAHHDIDRRDAALMLLHPPVAPNTTTPWTAGASAAAISIETPRVLYFDFERWYANRELQAASLANADAGQQLLMLLLDAYTERHTDTAIQAIIDRLPDPAVQGLLVELVCTDSLEGATPACEAVVIDLGGRLSSIAEELEQQHWGRKALLENIAEMFTITAKITTDGPLQLRTEGKLLHASVPPGMVAELRVSPIVAATHFQPRAGHPSVFFEPVRQMARRVRPDGTLVFAPATLRIEVMQDKLPGVERAAAGQSHDRLPQCGACA